MAAQVPQIVASLEFNDRTTAISPTTLFTPAEDGLFVLHYYVSPRTGSTGNVSTTATWTDDGGPQSDNLSGSDFSDSTSGSSGSMTFRAKASQAIDVSTALFGGSGQVYDAYYTLIQL